ncbi:MAG: chemotaxis protein CheD [Candidatus Riflebacteria bacterium]|nr:chemotaxis protein CheD [Candidatus Riflebacteria bacterium]
MADLRTVPMGKMDIAQGGELLAVYGIGSCVIMTFFNFDSQIGALAHVLLPDSTQEEDSEDFNLFKFADTAVLGMTTALAGRGVPRRSLVAKLVGGAEMFGEENPDALSRVGAENVAAAKEALKKAGIPLIAEDVGGSKGRSVTFDSSSGMLTVSVLGEEDKEI